MPYTIRWHVPEHIFYIKVTGHLSNENAQALNEDIRRYLAESSQPKVQMIMDDGDMEGLPGDNMAQHRDMMTVFTDARIDWAVGVGQVNPAVRFLQTVITRAFGFKTKRFDTVDDAIVFFRELMPHVEIPDFEPDTETA